MNNKMNNEINCTAVEQPERNFSPFNIAMRLDKYPELKTFDVTVYTYLTSFPSVKYDEDSCYPSMDTIAMRCRISKRSAQRSIERLMRTGLVIKTPEFFDNGRQCHNRYSFPVTDSEVAKAKERNIALLAEDKKVQHESKKRALEERIVKAKSAIAQHTRELKAVIADAIPRRIRTDSTRKSRTTLTVKARLKLAEYAILAISCLEIDTPSVST